MKYLANVMGSFAVQLLVLISNALTQPPTGSSIIIITIIKNRSYKYHNTSNILYCNKSTFGSKEIYQVSNLSS
jgi:hypothetical protein